MENDGFSGSITAIENIPTNDKISKDPTNGNIKVQFDAIVENQNHEPEIEVEERGPTLRKTLGVPSGVSFISGVIIGSGIFLSPTSILRNTNSVGLSLIIWLSCGFVSFLCGMCFIELGLMIPLSGSNYPYLNRGLSPLWGFLFTWTSCFIMRPASSAAITYAFALYVLQPFYSGGEDQIPVWQLKLVAVGVLVVLSLLNSLSVNGAARFQIFFTISKVLGLVVIVVTGIIRLGQGHTESFKNSFEGSNYDVGDIGFAMYAGLWAYGGWSELNYSVEEIKDVNRQVEKMIYPDRNNSNSSSFDIHQFVLVTVFYLLVNVSYSAVLSKEEMLASGAVAVVFGNKMLGVMSWCIPVFVACSTMGSANGGIFARGRMIFAAAREGHLPRVFGMIQTKFRTPIMGILFNVTGFAVIFLVPTGSNFDKLVGYLSFSTWLFHGLTILALLRLRYTEPDTLRPFKVWIIAPVISLLACIFLVVATFIKSPIETSVACGFIILGAPVYYAFVVKDISPKWLRWLMDKITGFFQKCFGIASTDEEDTGKENITCVSIKYNNEN